MTPITWQKRRGYVGPVSRDHVVARADGKIVGRYWKSLERDSWTVDFAIVGERRSRYFMIASESSEESARVALSEHASREFHRLAVLKGGFK